jgi:hypothetical protein
LRSRLIVCNWINFDSWGGTRVNKLLFKCITLTGLTEGVFRKASKISLIRTSPKKLREHESAILVPSPP